MAVAIIFQSIVLHTRTALGIELISSCFWIKDAAEPDASAQGRPIISGTGPVLSTPAPEKTAFNSQAHLYVGCVYSAA